MASKMLDWKIQTDLTSVETIQYDAEKNILKLIIYLLLVLFLRCQSSLNALPGLHKSLSLSDFTGVVSKNPSNICGNKKDQIGLYL